MNIILTRKRFMLLSLHFFLILTFPLFCYAMTMDEAKSAGLVGEQFNGYIGAIKPNLPDEVIKEMKRTNQKRRNYYESIAKENNLPLEDVENVAGSKLVQRAENGEYIKEKEGDWVKK